MKSQQTGENERKGRAWRGTERGSDSNTIIPLPPHTHTQLLLCETTTLALKGCVNEFTGVQTGYSRNR